MACETQKRIPVRPRRLEKKWTREDDELLVELIKSRHAIWNVSSPLYKDRIKKQKSWNDIAESINNSVLEVKNRWNVIKSRFNSERKKEHNRKNGSTFKTKFHLYKNLQFLVIPPTKSSGSEKGKMSVSESRNGNLEHQSRQSLSKSNYFDSNDVVCVHVNGKNSENILQQSQKKQNRISSKQKSLSQNFHRTTIQKEISNLQQTQMEGRWKKVFCEYIHCELDRYGNDDAQRLKSQLNEVCLKFKPKQKDQVEVFDSPFISLKTEDIDYESASETLSFEP